VESIGSFYLNPSPTVFLNDREPGASPVVQLVAARHVKSRKREQHGSVGGVINQKVHQDVAATAMIFRGHGPGDLEIVGELESELIVNTVEIGAHYSRCADMGAAPSPVPADNDPTVDRGDEKRFVEFPANGSLQHFGRDNIQVLDPSASCDGRRCGHGTTTKQTDNDSCG
jgi:hypothetical protein